MKEERCYSCMKMKEAGGICPYCGSEGGVLNEDHQLPVGTILKEQYLIGKVLGQGGFGITYIGWDRYLEIPVAIKEYFPSGTVSRNCRTSTDVISGSGEVGARFRSSRERFMREVKMLARLSDIPEIVRVKTFFLENNTAYIVMEYIEGITLKEYTEEKGGRLDYQETRKLLGPVIKALEKVHKAGVVHRDISPDNIMIQKDGRVKLLDFGAVRDVGLVSPDKPLSQSTEAILKQGYAPVEQYQKKGTLGPWTDVYAMCATIYFCLMGEVPTDAPGRMLGDPLKWFEDGSAEIPAQASRTLEKGMALLVQDRIRSMSELYHGLYEEDPDPDADQTPDPTPDPDPVPVPVPDQTPDPTPDPDPDPAPCPNPDKHRSLLWKAVAAGLLVIFAAVGIRAVTQNVFSPGNEEKQVESVQDKEPVLTPEPTMEVLTMDGQCGENVFWELDVDTGVLTLTGTGATWGYLGVMDREDDDQRLDGWPEWYSYRTHIRKVIVGPEITELGDTLFEACTNLKEIDFGNVENIHTGALAKTGLVSIVFPDSLKVLGDYSVADCEQLEEVTIPESVKTVMIPFAGCTSLKKVTILGSPYLGSSDRTYTGTIFEYEDGEGKSPDIVIYAGTDSSAKSYAMEHGIPFVALDDKDDE